MNILGEVAKELFGMFMADARLTTTTLVLVAIVAALIAWLRLDPALCGGILLIGSLAIVVEAVLREARLRGSR
jgi:hypothetical protein